MKTENAAPRLPCPPPTTTSLFNLTLPQAFILLDKLLGFELSLRGSLRVFVRSIYPSTHPHYCLNPWELTPHTWTTSSCIYLVPGCKYWVAPTYRYVPTSLWRFPLGPRLGTNFVEHVYS